MPDQKHLHPSRESCRSSETQEKSQIIELNGKSYMIVDKVGTGSSGTVYKLKEKSTNQSNQEPELILKFMKIKEERPNHKKKFSNEINLTKLFFKVYDHGEHDNLYYFIMEKVSGRSMPPLEHIKSFIDKNFPSLDEKKLLVWKLLNALERIHKKRIIHGDIKPENIMLDLEEKEIKLIDFGLSRKSNRFGAWHRTFMGCNGMFFTPETLQLIRHLSFDIFSMAGIIPIILGHGKSVIDDPSRRGKLDVLERHLRYPEPREIKPVISAKYCLDSLLTSSTLDKSQAFFIYLFLQWMQNDNPFARPTVDQCIDFFNRLKSKEEIWQLNQCIPFFMYPQVFIRLDDDQKNNYTTVVRDDLTDRLAPRRPVKTVLEYLNCEEGRVTHLLEHAFAGSPDQLNLSADYFDMKMDDTTFTEIECKEILYSQAYSVQLHFYPTESHDNAYFKRIKNDRIKHALIVTLANRGPIHNSWKPHIANDEISTSLYHLFFEYEMPTGLESYENYLNRIATSFSLSKDQFEGKAEENKEGIIVYSSIVTFIIGLKKHKCWEDNWAQYFIGQEINFEFSNHIEIIQNSKNHESYYYYKTLEAYHLMAPEDLTFLENNLFDLTHRCKILSNHKTITVMDELFSKSQLKRELLNYFFILHDENTLEKTLDMDFINFILSNNLAITEYLKIPILQLFHQIKSVDLPQASMIPLLNQENISYIPKSILQPDDGIKKDFIEFLIYELKKNQEGRLPCQNVTPTHRDEILNKVKNPEKKAFIQNLGLHSDSLCLRYLKQSKLMMRKQNPQYDSCISTLKVASTPVAITGIIPPIVALAQAKTLPAATAFCVTKFIAAGAGASIALSVAPLTLALVSGALLLGVSFLIAQHLITKTRTEEVLCAAYKRQTSLLHQ